MDIHTLAGTATGAVGKWGNITVCNWENKTHSAGKTRKNGEVKKN